MTEALKYIGEWFLPSNKENRLHGTLNYDRRNGGLLEISGYFSENNFYSSSFQENIILGITNDGKQITLYKCYITKTEGIKLIKGGESGKPTTIYIVNFIFEGAQVSSEDELRFNQINSSIHNLDEWVGITGFKYDYKGNDQFDIKYSKPSPINFQIDDDITGSFNFLISGSSFSPFIKSVNLNQKVEVSLNSKKEYSVEEILNLYFYFQNFLMLALYEKTFPKYITLQSDRFIVPLEEGGEYKKKIKLYIGISTPSDDSKTKLHFKMLFLYEHIKDEFPLMIRNWFKKYQLLEPTFNLLFEQFYNNDRFSENTFLNLAQAAESFHSRLYNHTRMTKEDYNLMKSSILGSTPIEYHAWLKDQFDFGNNLNLHTRLKELLEYCSTTILDELIGDKEKFIRQVKSCRNYYTHYSNNKKSKALSLAELFRLSEKLKLVLVCLFLIEIGYRKDKLNELLKDKKHLFQHL